MNTNVVVTVVLLLAIVVGGAYFTGYIGGPAEDTAAEGSEGAN